MSHKRVTFRIKELIAERERRTGQRTTYADIHDATGLSTNTISQLATGQSKMVGLSTIERLLEFFGCQVEELIVYE